MGNDQEQAEALSDQPTVFLSYARDDQARAQMLVKALESQGFRVWWDGLISGGHAFSDRIENALEESNAVVVLWSTHSIHSHWVRDEASFGRDHNRMVPISLDGSEGPLGFRQLHHIDFSQWQGSAQEPAFQQLCASINNVSGVAKGLPSVSGGKQGQFSMSRRQALVGAGAVAVLGGGVAYWMRSGASAQTGKIAVLPFRNISGNNSEDYFSDGLAEELRATLSQAEELSVAAQTSSDQFRDHKTDATTMASALGVAFLVEGSVRRSADTIRVAARIVDGKTGFDRWTRNFDRPATDSLAVQSDIAAFVTDAILADIDKEKRPSERIGGTKKSDAFDAYLKGTALYRLAAGSESDLAALREFDRATSIDPNYAAALAAKSRAHTAIANTSSSGKAISENYDKAVEAARAAIRIAPDMAEGHSALGFVLFNGQLDAKGAAAPYGRSYELGFGNADILSSFANFSGRVGKFDVGREAILRAEQLDPLNATVFRNAGQLEYAARDYEVAERLFRQALSINPKARSIKSGLGDIALLNGDFEAARTLYLEEGDEVSKLRGLAMADWKLNRQADAQKGLGALIKLGGESVHYQQAQIFAQWGRSNDALTHLEQAYAKRDAGLVRLRNDPLLDPARQDPRFKEIERRIGFA